MIRAERQGGLVRLTIDRPDKANSLTAAMLRDLCDGVKAAGSDAHALVITGMGKVFSAGADLDEARAGLAVSPLWEELSGAIAELPCLTIAALNGTLAGGAFGMALAADLRIAVPAANFFYPVMKLGFLPQPSDPARMERLIGPARTKMIFMAGQKIDSATALDWGLIDRVGAAQDLEAEVARLTEAVLVADAHHIAAIKRMIP